jgi:hypothetical protein
MSSSLLECCKLALLVVYDTMRKLLALLCSVRVELNGSRDWIPINFVCVTANFRKRTWYSWYERTNAVGGFDRRTTDGGGI